MQKIISYVFGEEGTSGTAQDLSEYAKKADVTAALTDYVKQETYEYGISKCVKQEDIAEDLVALTTENARITTTLRNGEQYGWTIDNVANAKNADTATKATCDSKGYNIVNSYTRANSIVTDIAGADDTLTISYTKNTNGAHSFVSSDIKIDNVEHAKNADNATVAVQDEDGYNIVQSYIRTDSLISGIFGNGGDTISFTTVGNMNGSYTNSGGEITIDNVAHAKEATKATQDGVGNVIVDTYAKKADLAAVATTGSYNDLTDTPTVPTKLSELTNDGVFVTEAKVQEMIDAITSADGKEY